MNLPSSIHNKVLIIHTDDFVREVLIFNLQRMNYPVQAIEDGRQAFELIRGYGTPRLVIMDLSLPYRNGHEVLRSYRKNTYWKSVPILILTRKKSSKKVEQAFREGASDYVKIPFDLQELRARVKRLVGHRP